MNTSNTNQEGAFGTPQVAALELTPKITLVAQTLLAQVTEYDNATNKYYVKPSEAFAVCLAASQNNARQAATLLIELVDGLTEWNASREGDAKDFPLP